MSNYFKQNSRFGTLNEEIKELKKDDRKTKDKKIEDKKNLAILSKELF